MTKTKQILHEMANTYRNKIDGVDPMIVQLEIQPDKYFGHVRVRGEAGVVLVDEPCPEANFTITMSSETLLRIYRGEISAFTATAREGINDPAPVDFRLAEGVKLSTELYSQMITFVQRFFWRSDPERILLGEEHSRFVHGGHAIPLFYSPGFRSAWYLVKKGERINDPGDHNPFPQGFVFISGEGRAEIGGKEVAIRAGEAYFIPPNASHMIWTESDIPLTLLWLAWGDGA